MKKSYVLLLMISSLFSLVGCTYDDTALWNEMEQLPYVPEYSSSVTGKLPEYFMSNISLERSFDLKWAEISLKGAINNLFDEEYLSVLSRPMPGIHFELFLGITPKWE